MAKQRRKASANELVCYRTASGSERDKGAMQAKRIRNPAMTNLSFGPAHYRSRFCNVPFASGQSVHFSETAN